MSFVIATTLHEALSAMAAGARPVAGGSDLVVGARQGRTPLPADLVAIDRLTELAEITYGPQGVSIGAVVSHHTITTHPLLVSDYSALADASALVGSPSTRNVGTIGGNVMNASPAMDTGAPLLALGAVAELSSLRGTRLVPLADLWLGPGLTSAAPDELCVAIHLPAPMPGSGSAYLRLEYRRAMEIAVVGASCAITLASDGTVAAVRVALTAVAPTIIEVAGLDTLAGRPVSEVAVAAQVAASAQAHPISDLRASADYRRHSVGVMARRVVEAAARRAAGEHLPVPLNRTIGIGAAS